jgi:hypothetical protein
VGEVDEDDDDDFDPCDVLPNRFAEEVEDEEGEEETEEQDDVMEHDKDLKRDEWIDADAK